MPFSKTTDNHTETYWTKHFENFLKPLIEQNLELEARRSDELRGNITNKIIFDLITSPIVIADLTDHNPNVFWELGIRQSFKHGTITIAEKNGEKKIPFDVFGKATLFYNLLEEKHDEFEKKFKSAIDDCLKNPDRPDSQVLETISGRGTLYEIINQGEIIRRLEALEIELKWNESLFNNCIAQAAKNRLEKLRINKYSTAPLLRFSAVELLLSNQYVKADPDFYSLANTYWIIIASLNSKLQTWHLSKKWTEEQILNNSVEIKKIINGFLEAVIKLRDEISKKY